MKSKSIHIFGANSLCGESFKILINKSVEKFVIRTYSRTYKNESFLDLNSPEIFQPIIDEDILLISFSPIWLLAPFLNKLIKLNHPFIKNLNGVIACSSSSSITKKYAFNKYDKELVSSLKSAEDQLINVCKKLNIKNLIIQPSMIYGEINKFSDKNISFIKKIIKFSPLIIIPENTGSRQPIHSIQLAKIIEKIIKVDFEVDLIQNNRILIGGDEIISYEKMLNRIFESISNKKKYKKYLFIKIPNRLFFFLFSPLIILSPQKYESIQRISANLSGFYLTNDILKGRTQKFPILKNYD